jgi:hypothetical protein
MGRATPKAGRLLFNPGRLPNALTGTPMLMQVAIEQQCYPEMVNKWVMNRSALLSTGCNYRFCDRA